jgi:hypothetical protein
MTLGVRKRAKRERSGALHLGELFCFEKDDERYTSCCPVKTSIRSNMMCARWFVEQKRTVSEGASIWDYLRFDILFIL